MQKKRSPRFPFIALKKALEFANAISEKIQDKTVPAPRVAKALGYTGMNGKANKVIAALTSYGLLERVGEADGARTFKLTNRAKVLSRNPNSPKNLTECRKAALAPMPFRRTWFNRPGVTQEELQTALVQRGFTEDGAKRASNVYANNVRFANLEDADFRASNVIPKPEPPKKTPGGNQPQTATMQKAAQGTSAVSSNPVRLVLPVGNGTATIPCGMTEDEFTTLLQTIRLWKPKLVTA